MTLYFVSFNTPLHTPLQYVLHCFATHTTLHCNTCCTALLQMLRYFATRTTVLCNTYYATLQHILQYIANTCYTPLQHCIDIYYTILQHILQHIANTYYTTLQHVLRYFDICYTMLRHTSCEVATNTASLPHTVHGTAHVVINIRHQMQHSSTYYSIHT